MNYLVDVVAFPVAGVLVAVCVTTFGMHSAGFVIFGVDSVSYLLSAALLVGLPTCRAHADRVASPLASLGAQVAEGLRFLAHNAQLRTNTVLLTLGPLLLGSLHTLWIGFAWRVSHTDTFGYGIIETANALGTLVGLCLLSRVLRRLNPGRVILLGFLVMGMAIAAAGLTDSLLVVGALAAAAGLGNMVFLIPSITLVQRHTPSELRGRVFAVRLMLTFGAFAVSNAVAGGLADSLGVSALLLGLGCGMLLMAGAGMLFSSAREAG